MLSLAIDHYTLVREDLALNNVNLTIPILLRSKIGSRIKAHASIVATALRGRDSCRTVLRFGLDSCSVHCVTTWPLKQGVGSFF